MEILLWAAAVFGLVFWVIYARKKIKTSIDRADLIIDMPCEGKSKNTIYLSRNNDEEIAFSIAVDLGRKINNPESDSINISLQELMKFADSINEYTEGKFGKFQGMDRSYVELRPAAFGKLELQLVNSWLLMGGGFGFIISPEVSSLIAEKIIEEFSSS